jgi:dTDP-4-dehydrorhamnose reductase
MLAEVTAQVIGMGGASITPWMQERRGVYHLAGNGGASRFDWAQAILANDPAREEQTAEALLPAKSADFPTPALRPAYSILDCGKLENTFGLRLPAWDAALALAMDEMGQA